MRLSARVLFLLALVPSPLAEAQRARHAIPDEAREPGTGLAELRSLTRSRGPAGSPVAVRLPSGGTTLVRLEHFASTRPGGSTAYGPDPTDPHGYAAFAAQDDGFAGVVRTEGDLYRVKENASGKLELEWVDPSSIPPCDLALDPAGAAAPSPPAAEGAAPPPSRYTTPGPFQPTFSPQVPSSVGDTVVDVLVVWTRQAILAVGHRPTLIAKIDLAVLETNMAYDLSGVGLHMRLVHIAGLTYNESGDMALDLFRLRHPSDGQMDEVHALRDSYGADAVSLFVANTSACGRSYNMGAPPSAAFASSAFNLVSQECATGVYAFAHEFGHNFGLDHDRPNTSNVPSHPYAYGYWSQDGVHRTIMSLELPGNPGVRVPYYSNPDVSYLGFPLGIPHPDPHSSDCARALDENAAIIAAWRSTAVP